MKIIIVGASGAVGKAAFDELSTRHEIIRVGRSSGDMQVILKTQRVSVLCTNRSVMSMLLSAR